MPEVSLGDWQDFIDHHPDAHLLQTAEWGELKTAFGWEAVRLVSGSAGAQVLFRKLPAGISIAYIPKASALLFSAMQDAEFWRELASICRARHAVLLKVEPDAWDSPAFEQTLAGFMQNHDELHLRRSAYSIQPPRTLVVDLTGSEEELLARMKQKCRYNVRLAEKKGVMVHSWNDLEGFHALVRATGGRDGFGVHSQEYYQTAYELFHRRGRCELLVAEYGGAALAALMVLRQGFRAWYLYGASNELERSRMPAYLLQWEGMRWAKSHGCEQYDLWGVPDESEEVLETSFENRTDGLWGVYRFKRGFGGALKRSAQAVDIVFNPILYRLYTWRMTGRENG